MKLFGLRTKCPCGCDETHFKLWIFRFFIFFFTDCGEWWIKLGTPWKIFSYSPCQGFTTYSAELERNNFN